jgi:hypothetical protein
MTCSKTSFTFSCFQYFGLRHNKFQSVEANVSKITRDNNLPGYTVPQSRKTQYQHLPPLQFQTSHSVTSVPKISPACWKCDETNSKYDRNLQLNRITLHYSYKTNDSQIAGKELVLRSKCIAHYVLYSVAAKQYECWAVSRNRRFSDNCDNIRPKMRRL